MTIALFEPCPKCGEEEHTILHERPQSVTIQCTECQSVRSINPPKRAAIIELNTVVSHDDKSWNVLIPTPADEIVSVGDEFELDDHRMIVTAIELDGQQQRKKSVASEIRSLFAKVFDTVPLKLSVNDRDVTRSYRIDVSPDMEICIGLVLAVEGELLAVKTLKSDQNRTLHKGFLLARNVRRAFCDEAPRRAKEGDITFTRRRGLPPGEKSDSPSRRIKGPRGQRSRSPKR